MIVSLMILFFFLLCAFQISLIYLRIKTALYMYTKLPAVYGKREEVGVPWSFLERLKNKSSFFVMLAAISFFAEFYGGSAIRASSFMNVKSFSSLVGASPLREDEAVRTYVRIHRMVLKLGIATLLACVVVLLVWVVLFWRSIK